MSSQKRFSKAYKKAKRISFDDTSKLIFFSDCHRGDDSFADDFANNKNIYYHALKHYFNREFTYCEIGDGTELWENLDFNTVFRAHKHVYKLLQEFYESDRLHIIYGNHDMVFRDAKYLKKNVYTYFDHNLGKDVALLNGISCPEAIVLKHSNTNQEIFCTHGHQADFMNYVGWRINRLLVRFLWKPLQFIGIADPTSPAKNYKELIKVERRTKAWIANNNNILTITGHTHRPRFPNPGDIPYFNDGSCVHPRSITGIEIENGKITLIKWSISTTDEGVLKIIKTNLEGPIPLTDYSIKTQ